ncbi:MAG: phenylalanine--tRNA ligase subunit beta [Geobacter sp.]|nr:phenylalanine--tRNA ligase subunit beta [Geobacter sp.]
MIATYNWLKEYVDFDLSPQDLADLLTMLGLEVEGMTSLGGGMDDVVVALIEERNQHPNADRLSLCRVNNGREVLEIVCGATNMKAGDRVALAQIGAVLPGDFKIKRSKIRGVESFGMLCSEKELGLAEESEGIMILPPDLQLGSPVFEALGLKDTIFEIGLTPNRADCLSVIGIAREIAAKLGKRVNYPKVAVGEGNQPITEIASVTIEDPHGCPRYAARYISGCKIGSSPEWLVSRLKAVGVRSINNVVDVTNYVMMEFGHPLHAFDYHFLQGGKIVVRKAGEGELFKTLDGQERLLKGTDLTIRDGERAVALAGVMGGQNSEISDATTDVLLESACFEPMTIRRTARRLGLHSESSHRFERGADIGTVPKALDRAAALIAELSGGVMARGSIDVYPGKKKPKQIPVRLARVNQILGTNLTAEAIRDIFHNLEFVLDPGEAGEFLVSVPSFRVDIEREIDLIEEVARLNGFENIPVTMPRARTFSDRPTRSQLLAQSLKQLLVANGLSEVITYSFIAPALYDRIGLASDDPRRAVVNLLNPLSDDQSVMRTSLLPGLLETASRNIGYRILDQRIFEMGRVFLKDGSEELPAEPTYIAGILTGARELEGWNQGKDCVDFYDMKGVVENILASLNIAKLSYESRDLDSFYHPGKACSVCSGSDIIGSLGEIHPDVQEAFGIEQRVYYFELNFDKLLHLCRDIATITPPSRFPDTFRDTAMLLDDEVPAAAVLGAIKGLKIGEIEDAAIFDLYKGASIPAGKKSLAVRVRYRSLERTLTDDEVNRLHQRVVDTLTSKYSAEIR